MGHELETPHSIQAYKCYNFHSGMKTFVPNCLIMILKHLRIKCLFQFSEAPNIKWVGDFEDVFLVYYFGSTTKYILWSYLVMDTYFIRTYY